MNPNELVSHHIFRRRILRDICRASRGSTSTVIEFDKLVFSYRLPIELSAAIYLELEREGLIETVEFPHAKVTEEGLKVNRNLFKPYRYFEENKIYVTHLIYRLSHGNTGREIEQDSLFRGAIYFSDIGLRELIDVVEEIEKDGFIEWTNGLLNITENGVRKVEDSDFYEVILKMEDNEFMPRKANGKEEVPQHIHNYHGPVGSIQHGDGNQSNVYQSVGMSTPEVAHLIGQLRETLRESPEATNYLDVLQEEVALPEPNRKVLKTAIAALSLTAQQLAAKLTDGSADILIQAIKAHLKL